MRVSYKMLFALNFDGLVFRLLGCIDRYTKIVGKSLCQEFTYGGML
jgi:hypothetical protein